MTKSDPIAAYSTEKIKIERRRRRRRGDHYSLYMDGGARVLWKT